MPQAQHHNCTCPPGTATFHVHADCWIVQRWLTINPHTQDGIAGARYDNPRGLDAVHCIVAPVLHGELAPAHVVPCGLCSPCDPPIHVLECLAHYVRICCEEPESHTG